MENTDSTTITPVRYLKSLQIIHGALFLGPVFLGAFAFYQNKNIITNFDMTSDPFLYAVPVFGLLGYFASDFLFKKILTRTSMNDTLQRKQATYQTASIIKYACLEGPTVLAIIAFMNNGLVLYASIALLLLIYLFIQRPNLDKLRQALPLKQEEERLFHQSGKFK